MANHAKVLDVSEEDRQVLVSRVQARTVSVRDLERARIVLLAAEPKGCPRPRSRTAWVFSSDGDLVAVTL
jgi:hypothetical protein